MEPWLVGCPSTGVKMPRIAYLNHRVIRSKKQTEKTKNLKTSYLKKRGTSFQQWVSPTKTQYSRLPWRRTSSLQPSSSSPCPPFSLLGLSSGTPRTTTPRKKKRGGTQRREGAGDARTARRKVIKIYKYTVIKKASYFLQLTYMADLKVSPS